MTSRSADRRSPSCANQSAYSLSQVPTLLTHSAGAGAKVLHVRILLSQGIPTTVLAYPRFLNARHAGYYRVRESSIQKGDK